MDERIQVSILGTQLWARPVRCDHVVIDEVITRDVYRVAGTNMRGWTVVDVGANVGSFSVLCAHAGAQRVIAIEPEPDNLDLLRLNTKDWPAIEIMPVAVGACAGHARIGGEASSAHLDDESLGPKVRVERLDHLLDSLAIYGRVDFLKLDVEGAEADILLALSHDRLARVGRIAMEVHGPDWPWIDRARTGEIVEHLMWTHDLTVEGSPALLGYVFGTLKPR